MIIKVGTDICSINRIKLAYERYGQRFAERILTEAEREYVLSNAKHLPQRLAGRFAAKEAVSKVLGVGWRGISWKEIEIARMSSGAPTLRLFGRAASIAEKLGLTSFEVSLSHEREYATAVVIGYGAAKES